MTGIYSFVNNDNHIYHLRFYLLAMNEIISTSKVSDGRRIVLPPEAMADLGVAQGDKVCIVRDGGRIVLTSSRAGVA